MHISVRLQIVAGQRRSSSPPPLSLKCHPRESGDLRLNRGSRFSGNDVVVGQKVWSLYDRPMSADIVALTSPPSLPLEGEVPGWRL